MEHQDGQEVGTAILYAEAKLGELLREIKPKYVGFVEGTRVPKQVKTLPENITKKQTHHAQQLAENPKIVLYRNRE